MKIRTLAFLSPLLALASCSTPGSDPGTAGSGTAAPTAPAVTKSAVLAPANPTAWAYWPEEWNGPLLVLEVVPHGAQVKSGDVLARIDLRDLEEAVRTAQLEVRSAQVRHSGLVERQRIEDDSSSSSLAQARAALARSERSHAAWKERDLSFEVRSDEISQRQERSYVEDQVDELAQLEEMYKRDELVNGTEDLVLKRQKRALGIAQDSTALSRDRSKKRFDLDLTLEREQRDESLRAQTEAVARQARAGDIDRAARIDALQRSAEELADKEARLARLGRDREALAAKSPRDGVFLHGSTRDWRQGRSPTRIERGATLALHAEVASVAEAGTREARLELVGSDLALWKDGARVVVKPVGSAALTGILRVDPWPRGDGNFDARVELQTAAALPAGTRAEVEIAK